MLVGFIYVIHTSFITVIRVSSFKYTHSLKTEIACHTRKYEIDTYFFIS